MSLRDELVKRIEKKRREIADLELKIRSAVVYIQALEDTLKLVPSEEVEDVAGLSASADALRSGSKNDRARQILRAAGEALHVSRILELMGEKVDPDSIAALVGSLGAYVRDKKIFTRPGPNTFGLIEFDDSSQAQSSSTPSVAQKSASTNLRKRLHEALVEARQIHLADAVENCEVAESDNEVVFTASKVYQMFLSDAVFEKTVIRTVGRPVRVVVKIRPVAATPVVSAPRPPKGFGVDPPKIKIPDDEPSL
jgi:hypothetical protein